MCFDESLDIDKYRESLYRFQGMVCIEHIENPAFGGAGRLHEPGRTKTMSLMGLEVIKDL
jgi:hypothetical protein